MFRHTSLDHEQYNMTVGQVSRVYNMDWTFTGLRSVYHNPSPYNTSQSTYPEVSFRKSCPSLPRPCLPDCYPQKPHQDFVSRHNSGTLSSNRGPAKNHERKTSWQSRNQWKLCRPSFFRTYHTPPGLSHTIVDSSACASPGRHETLQEMKQDLGLKKLETATP